MEALIKCIKCNKEAICKNNEFAVSENMFGFYLPFGWRFINNEAYCKKCSEQIEKMFKKLLSPVGKEDRQ